MLLFSFSRMTDPLKCDLQVIRLRFVCWDDQVKMAHIYTQNCK